MKQQLSPNKHLNIPSFMSFSLYKEEGIKHK